MCWTITIPGHTRGSAVRTASSACVPPVEVPRATTCSVVCAMASWRGACGSAADGPDAPPAGATVRLGRARAASRMMRLNSAACPCRKSRSPNVGLVTKETAPADSAAIVVLAPFSVRVEQITTGVGRSAIS